MNVPPVQAGEAHALVRTIKRCPDPIGLFASCSDGGLKPGSLLLETAETAETAGSSGKSLIFVNAALRIACRGQQVTVHALNTNATPVLHWLADQNLGTEDRKLEGELLTCRFPPPGRGSEAQRLHAPSPVDLLRALMRLSDRVGEPSTTPILAGTFGYDLLGCYETLPPCASDPLDWPDYELWLPDQLIWLDHERGTATAVTHLYGGEDATRCYGTAAASIGRLEEAIERAGTSTKQTTSIGSSPVDPAKVQVDLDDEGYASLVARLKHHITAGDLFQIVPSRTFSTPCTEPLEAYAALRELNPSPYMFYISGHNRVLFGASPEIALRVEGDSRRVNIRPIAGTRPRGLRLDGTAGLVLDPDLDNRLEAELRLDEKELAEHMMLVDLARNDVSRVCTPGTRQVDRLLTVERYSHVMHLVSHVSGTLRPDLDALHAYVATMNMGTLVGAPKLRAAELLRRYEKTKRGPYGGAVGYVTANGHLDSAIIIRSAQVQEGRAHVRAGAGVVFDSVPEAEAMETRRKAEAVLQAIWRTHSSRGKE